MAAIRSFVQNASRIRSVKIFFMVSHIQRCARRPEKRWWYDKSRRSSTNDCGTSFYRSTSPGARLASTSSLFSVHFVPAWPSRPAAFWQHLSADWVNSNFDKVGGMAYLLSALVAECVRARACMCFQREDGERCVVHLLTTCKHRNREFVF